MMGIKNCVSEHQILVICNLIKQQEIKRAQERNPDLYDRHKGDAEFWQGFAVSQTEKLINSNPNGSYGYHDNYELRSKGLVQGAGYNLELRDGHNKEKYFIHYDGHIEEPEEWIKSDGGCYVATCVYGSYDCPPVWTLRRFRDDTLAQNLFGRVFIKFYYAISPTAVKWFGQYEWFHKLFKKQLDKWVKKLNSDGIDNTPYND